RQGVLPWRARNTSMYCLTRHPPPPGHGSPVFHVDASAVIPRPGKAYPAGHRETYGAWAVPLGGTVGAMDGADKPPWMGLRRVPPRGTAQARPRTHSTTATPSHPD